MTAVTADADHFISDFHSLILSAFAFYSITELLKGLKLFL